MSDGPGNQRPLFVLQTITNHLQYIYKLKEDKVQLRKCDSEEMPDSTEVSFT